MRVQLSAFPPPPLNPFNPLYPCTDVKSGCRPLAVPTLSPPQSQLEYFSCANVPLNTNYENKSRTVCILCYTGTLYHQTARSPARSEDGSACRVAVSARPSLQGGSLSEAQPVAPVISAWLAPLPRCKYCEYCNIANIFFRFFAFYKSSTKKVFAK